MKSKIKSKNENTNTKRNNDRVYPKSSSELPKLNLNAAGIDIGSQSHYVAVPQGRDEQCVREFKSYTSDLYAMASWLKDCGVETVAMESTSVYWVPVFQVLESLEFEVILVNPKYVKNVAGRKTDVSDCQWIQQLHTYGLLPASFRPDGETCVLRAYWRHRDMLVKYATAHIQHMQKALDLMNIHIHKAISDITGLTGMRIIQAILDGERNPEVLAQMRDPRIKCSKDELVQALQGDYRPEHLFTLRQALNLYEFYWQQIVECDKHIEMCLTQIGANRPMPQEPAEACDADCGVDGAATKPRKKKRVGSNAPKFDLQSHLIKLSGGVDVTEIDGMNVVTGLTAISETGLDMSKWLTEKHFSSWLGLSPNNRISGGKVLSAKTKKVASRAACAFRMAAQSLHRSPTALGAFYRRVKSRLGAKAAVIATAHKIARIYYNMLKYGQDYVDQGQDYYNKRYQDRLIKGLQKKAAAMGYQLVECASCT
jgi:transposase